MDTEYVPHVAHSSAAGQTIKLADWGGILDRFLESNELHVLHGNGTRSKSTAEMIAHRRYDEFDHARKEAARKIAESEPDIDVSAALGEIEQKTRLTRRTRKPKGYGVSSVKL